MRRDLNKLLCELYEKQELTTDHLPYTQEFDIIHTLAEYEMQKIYTKHFIWETLLYLRKDGTLPRKSKKKIINKSKPKRELKKQVGGFFS